jgi:hypothetical protein
MSVTTKENQMRSRILIAMSLLVGVLTKFQFAGETEGHGVPATTDSP